jgi:hypothetical protein
MAEVSGPRTFYSGVASGDLNFADPACYRILRKIGKDVLLSTSGDPAFGVLNNKPKDNEHASVCVHGFTKVALASSLGPDALVQAGVNGFATLCLSGFNSVGRLITGGNSGMVGELFFTVAGSGN